MTDPNTTTLIITEIIGGVFLILSAVIILLLKQSFKRSGKLHETVLSVDSLVKGLKLELKLYRNDNNFGNKVRDRRLNRHSEKIAEIDKEVAVLNSKIK